MALAASGLPTGVTASFSSASITGTATSTLTFNVGSTAAAGTSTITVTGTSGSLTSTTTVGLTVVSNPILASIQVLPSTAALHLNASQQFTATADDQFGHALTSQPTFTWSLGTGGVGAVSSSGSYASAATAGSATVKAVASGVTGTAAATVTNAPPTVVTAAAASPNPVTGATASLGVLGADDGGQANLNYTWSTTSTPPAAVAFSPNGTNSAQNTAATFTKAGTYRLLATITDNGGLSVTSAVTVVVSQTATGIAASPSSTTVSVGASQQFTASVLDQFGNTDSSIISYSALVGTVTSTGLYTAPAYSTTDTLFVSGAGFQGTALINVTGLPAAPTGLTATPGNGQVSLYWSPSLGAATYSVYRGTSAAGESSTPIATVVSGISYADSTVTNGTTYYYVVTAVNATGSSGDSDEANATPAADLLAAPTGLTAAPSYEQIALSWNTASGATSYDIYRFTAAGPNSSAPYQIGVTTTNFKDTGLTDGLTYYYAVAAINSSTQSAYSNEAYGTPNPPVPPPPSGLTASPGNTQVALTWTASTGAVSYDIYRGTSPGAEAPTACQTGVSGLSYTDVGLTNGTTYYYTATAVSAVGEGVHSTEANATPLSTIIWAPAALWAVAGASAVDLSWSTSPGATTYDLYRGTTTGGEGTTPYQTGLTTPSYSDSSVTNGATYYYTVTALLASTQTAASIEASAEPNVPPTAPTGLTVTGGILQVLLNWSSPTSGATSYNVYRGISTGQESKAAVATGVTTTSFTDTDPALSPGQIYYYDVTAVLNGIEGAPSGEAYAAPSAPAPSAPVIVSSLGGDTTASLSWSTPQYAATYSVYRGTAPGAEASTPIASGLTQPTYNDTGLIDGNYYYYTVVAVGSGGSSSPSGEATIAPYGAVHNLIVTPGDVETLLTWSPVAGSSGNGGGYEVLRSITSGGPYTEVNDALVSAGDAYLDDDNDNGLVTGTTYYYVVTYLDENYLPSPPSAEESATTVARNGTWGIMVVPSGTSSGSSSVTNAYSNGTTNLTTALAGAGISDPQSSEVSETGDATIADQWTAVWSPSTSGACPGLTVIEENQSQSVDDQVTGESSITASATITGGLSLTSIDPATAVAAAPTTVLTPSINTTVSGMISIGTATAYNSLTLTQSSGVTTGYAAEQSEDTHILHVYTPAYFTQNFPTTGPINLTFDPPNSTVTALATAPAGTLSGVGASAGGSSADVFAIYEPNGN